MRPHVFVKSLIQLSVPEIYKISWILIKRVYPGYPEVREKERPFWERTKKLLEDEFNKKRSKIKGLEKKVLEELVEDMKKEMWI